jgi:hypothetical protein
MTIVSEAPPLAVSPSSLYELTSLIERSVGMLEVGFKPQSESLQHKSARAAAVALWNKGVSIKDACCMKTRLRITHILTSNHYKPPRNDTKQGRLKTEVFGSEGPSEICSSEDAVIHSIVWNLRRETRIKAEILTR